MRRIPYLFYCLLTAESTEAIIYAMPRSMDLPEKKNSDRVKRSKSSDNIVKYLTNCRKEIFIRRDCASGGDDRDFDDDDDEEDADRNEVLLITDRSQFCFAQNKSRLSPPLVPQSVTSGFDCDLECCLTEDEQLIDANVSPMRTALSNIQEFVETTVVLRKDKKNELGISIVGGNDTYLVSRVFVFHLF